MNPLSFEAETMLQLLGHAQLYRVCRWNDGNGEFDSSPSEFLRAVIRTWLMETATAAQAHELAIWLLRSGVVAMSLSRLIPKSVQS